MTVWIVSSFSIFMLGIDNALRDLRVTLQNEFSTMTTTPVDVLTTSLCICLYLSIFVAQSRRQTTVRYRVTRERPDEAKNWRHQRETVPRLHSDIVSARLNRACTHTWRDVLSPSPSPSVAEEEIVGKGRAVARRQTAGEFQMAI